VLWGLNSDDSSHMKLLFDAILILFTAFFLILTARGAGRELKGYGRSKCIFLVPILVGLFGFAGFFVQMLSGEGIVKLPMSYEWPAGYVTNVVATADNRYVVPIVPSGRVQLYDSNWHFLRGWNVDALGGDFKVAANSPGTVEVFTARGQHHYTFAENGELISSSPLTESYYSLPNSGRSEVVSTPLLLWPLSNPFISVAVGTLGFLLLRLVKKFSVAEPKPK
jgi:hypothetical protein